MLEAGVVLGRWRDRMRLRGGVVLFVSVLFGAGAVVGATGDTRMADKAVIALIGCVAGAAYGLWRVVFVPPWLAHPENIDRIERYGPGGVLQVVMIGGKAHDVPVKPGERDSIADALQQRCNEIRLRARVVDRS